MHDHYVTYRPGNRGRSSWPSSSDAVRVLCTASGDEYCKAGALRSAAQTVQCQGAAAECPELFNPFGILKGGGMGGILSALIQIARIPSRQSVVYSLQHRYLANAFLLCLTYCDRTCRTLISELCAVGFQFLDFFYH